MPGQILTYNYNIITLMCQFSDNARSGEMEKPMKKKFVQIAALCLAAVLLVASGGRQSASAESSGNTSGTIIRVGLHHDGPYGTGSMEGLNLANETGTGFRFGYYDSSNQFVLLGATKQTAISVVKTVNVYYGTYDDYKSYHSALTTSGVAVGEYHLELPGTYSSFTAARAAAAAYEGGFPAWIGGEFHARIGSYTTGDKAAAAQAALAERGVETEIKGTSAYGLSVVITGTNTILFQFDDLGKGTGLGIEPNAVDLPEDTPEDDPTDDPTDDPENDPADDPTGDPENDPADDPTSDPESDPADDPTEDPGNDPTDDPGDDPADDPADAVKYTTWSKGYKYYGGFRYERIKGGNITVVNILDLEDYIKGVVPYEMSNSWHLEALKAQAVVARSYALSLGSRHGEGHFDLCDNTHCQAYHGLNQAGSNSDAAVDQTAGQVVLYNNKVVPTYYYSSNGGASESVSVVWGSNQASYPYLVGKIDPYEASLGMTSDNYTRTVSSDTLVAKLKDRGYNTVGSSIVSIAITSLTDVGNPRQVTFTDNNGKQFTLSTQKVYDMLGLRSYRYGFEASGTGVSVNGADPVDMAGLYVIDGSGNVAAVAGDVYALTGSGTIKLEQDMEASGGIGNLGSTTGVNGMFTFIGKGWGHNVGMSQYGALAMARQGYTYLDILQFYYTGITVGFM